LNQELNVAIAVQMEKLFLDNAISIPLYSGVTKEIFTSRVITVFPNHDPLFGWGMMWADIDLTR
jgi:hypothetical protein